ncbi:hypothetical protein AAG906_022195 [Vitis piasezkii]
MRNKAKYEIELETSIGCKLVRNMSRHVLEMHFSLISIRKLDDKGYHSHLGEASIELWHKWLGHISEKRLRVLAKKKFLPVKVHTDVCTMQSNTLGGALYYVTFSDDPSRKLKSVRAYNSGEFKGPFKQYCRSHGIRLEKTVPKTLQQNGIVERMKRTICDIIRCMLSHAKLSKSFWGDAMKTTIDLINLSPSYPLEDDITEKVWTAKFVSFKHFRVFGCKAFVHVLRDEWPKLDNKTK